MHSLSLAAAPFFPGVAPFLSATGHAPPLPRMSPFGGSDSSNPDAPFVHVHLHRSPLPPSSLRSVSETEDEEDKEEQSDENAPLPIFAPQATAPIRAGAFDGIASNAGEVPITIKEENPNFAIGFGLDQDDEEGVSHASFGQQPLDLTEFGGLPASSTGEKMDGLDEVDPDIDDGVTEGAFITPSHSRQVSRAIDAAINQPPPRQRHQPGLSNASVQSVMRIEELRPPNPPDANSTGIDAGDENAVKREREMSVVTDDYAGGDEKENIPPPVVHDDLRYVWPRPAANADVAHERRASAEDWTNPSTQSLRPVVDGEVWTNSENDEVSGEYLDARSDDEVSFSRNSLFLLIDADPQWSNPSDEEREREARRQRRQNGSIHRVSHPGPSASVGSAFGLNKPAVRQPSDEIISNPSEEEREDGPSHYYSADGPSTYYSPRWQPADSIPGSGDRSSRPLPLAPSNATSPTPNAPGSHSRSASLAGRERLNPHAKPFVFNSGGAPAGAPKPNLNGSLSPRSVNRSFTPNPTHFRQASVVKLNAAAAEFKPSFLSSTSFNFRPPPGMPSLTFPEPAAVAQARSPRPLPVPPLPPSPPPRRASQGREKRQRRLSSLDAADKSSTHTDGDTVPLFEFPPDWPTTTEELIAQSNAEVAREPMPRRKSILNPAAKPFTFSGANTPNTPHQLANTSSSTPATVPGSVRSKRSADGLDDAEADDDSRFVPQTSLTDTPGTPVRSPQGASKGRRPSIPDFRHPVSTKTVPASVFKALSSAGADSATRLTVKSRLSSREKLFEGHGHHGSLDDINVPLIARRSTKSLPLQSHEPGSPFSSVVNDVFTQSPEVNHLNLSFNHGGLDQQQHHRPSTSSSSDRVEWRKPSAELGIDSGLLDILEEKFDAIRRVLDSRRTDLTPSDIRSALTDFIPVLNTQLQAQLSAHRELVAADDSMTDAKGELDYEHLHSVIEAGHHELRASLQRDIAELAQTLEHQASPHSVYPLVQEIHKDVVGALKSTASIILDHLDSSDEAARRRPADERQKLLQELLHVLIPHINTLKSEPFDIDHVTMRVSEAVKPHITQLIDLASDKKETAAIIVDHLLPVLSIHSPQPRDSEELYGQLAADLRSAVAQIDAHALKEAVADLVIERLDARLANQDDLSEHLEELAKRISVSLAPSLEHSEKLSAAQDGVTARINDILGRHHTMQSEQTELLSRLSSLPDALTAASTAIATAHTELVAKSRALADMQDLQEVVKAHAEAQIELGQARSTIPQLIAEKDILNKRVTQLELEAEAKQAEVDRLRASVSSQDALVAELELDAKALEIEKAKAEVEGRCQVLEANVVAREQQIESLQSDKQTLQAESGALQSKVCYQCIQACISSHQPQIRGSPRSTTATGLFGRYGTS